MPKAKREKSPLTSWWRRIRNEKWAIINIKWEHVFAGKGAVKIDGDAFKCNFYCFT